MRSAFAVLFAVTLRVLDDVANTESVTVTSIDDEFGSLKPVLTVVTRVRLVNILHQVSYNFSLIVFVINTSHFIFDVRNLIQKSIFASQLIVRNHIHHHSHPTTHLQMI